MKKTGMTKAQIVEWAERHGWRQDKYGHMQKTIGDREYRLKLQDTSLRREVKIKFEKQEYSPARSEWMRIGGGYYKDAHLMPDDKLSLRHD